MQSTANETTAANKAVVARLIDEVIAGGRFELMDELVGPNFVSHNLLDTGEESLSVGREIYRQEMRALKTAFPDLTLDTLHLFADGDIVIAHVRARGTHRGDLDGIPPSGRRINSVSITLLRLQHGQLVERWNVGDRYALLWQVGAIAPRTAPQA